MASLAFAAILALLPAFLDMSPILRAACYVVALLPAFSFLALFFLGISDGLFIRRVLKEQ
jgi:hypothetical protein